MVSFIRSWCLLRALLTFTLIDMLLYGGLFIASATMSTLAAFQMDHGELSVGIVGSHRIQNLFLLAFSALFCFLHVVLAVYLRHAVTKNNNNSCLKWVALFPILMLLGNVLIPLLPYFRDGCLHSYIVSLEISLLCYNVIEYLTVVCYVKKLCTCNKDIPKVEGLYGELF